MDELLSFIVIWIVLYLFNLLSKKLKKENTSPQKTAGKKIATQAEQRAPTSKADEEWDLRDLFDEVTGRKKTPAQTSVDAEDQRVEESKASAPEEERYHDYSREKQYPYREQFEEESSISREDLTEIPVSEDSPILQDDKTLLQPSLEETLDQVKSQKKQYSSYKRRLKQAIIWKEILDKPVSLRFPPSVKNRNS